MSGIFGFSRKWSGGVSSDDMGGANAPAILMAEIPPARQGEKKGPPAGRRGDR